MPLHSNGLNNAAPFYGLGTQMSRKKRPLLYGTDIISGRRYTYLGVRYHGWPLCAYDKLFIVACNSVTMYSLPISFG